MKYSLLHASKLGLTALFILTGWSSQSQMLASTQQTKTQETTKNAATRSLSDVLSELKRHYQVDLLFEPKTVQGISVDSRALNTSLSLEQNLGNLLRLAGLTYKKINRTSYTISEHKRNKTGQSSEARFPVISASESETLAPLNPQPAATVEPVSTRTTQPAADVSVRGIVRDENGEGLPGVSVVVKGTQRGTTSDAEGSYKIEVPDASAILIFSYVGYLAQEISIGNKTTLDVILQTNNRTLDEIVVVGYGTQKRKDLTGAVGRTGCRTYLQSW